MDSSITHAHHPDLRVRNALAKLLASAQLVGIDRILSAFDVDGNKLAPIRGLEFRLHLLLVNGAAAPGEFLLTVATLRGSHGLLPCVRSPLSDHRPSSYLDAAKAWERQPLPKSISL